MNRSLWWSGIAASLIIACVASYIGVSRPTTSDRLLTVLDQAADADTVSEGLLIIDDVTIKLDGSNALRYDSDGNITIDDKRILLRKTGDISSKYNVLIVPKGQKYIVTLSDNTKVYVNSGTKLAYPTLFGKGFRNVVVDGEALFEVAKDASHPFVVAAQGFNVKVLGTVFDINAYQSRGNASVVLLEGSVCVTTDDDASMKLNPNQMIEIEHDYMSLQDVDVSSHVAWRYDMLYLDGKNMRTLLEELSERFGYNIDFNAEVGDMAISGKLDMSGSFATIMDNICLLMNLDYRIATDRVIITKKQ